MRLWGVAGACAIVLALSACGFEPDNSDGDKTITETINGQMMRVDLAGGSSKGLAIWFHGQGGTADTRMNEVWLNKLRVAGWSVASSDFHGNHWGGPAAVADTKALLAWAAEKTGRPATLYVAGSMGGLVSLNSMIAGIHSPKCWYGTMPVVDQTTVGNVPNSGEQITAAYGGPVPASSNPSRNLAKLPAGKYRVLSSPDDTLVPATRNADVLTRALKSMPGVQVTTLTVQGEHGDPTHFNPDDLATFAKGCF